MLMEWEFSEGAGNDGQFMATGKVVEAIRRHLGRNEIDQAVALYESCAQEAVAAQIWAEFGAASTSTKKAIANLFYRARDHARAAEACEVLGEWGAAAKAHMASYAWDRAAGCFLRTGEKDKAAKMFEKAGQHRKAAEIYYERGELPAAAEALEKAGDPLGAGQLFVRAKDDRRAAQVLAQVGAADPRFVHAAGLLGEVLVRLGRPDLAMQRLGAALPAGEPLKDELRAEIAYRLGRLLAEAGQGAQARRAFELVHAFNPRFRDVAARLEAARGSGADPQATVPVAPSSTGAFRAPGAGAARGPAPAQPTDPFASLNGDPFAARAAAPAPAPAAAEVVPAGYVQRMDGYEMLKRLPLFEELSLDEMRAFFQVAEPVVFEAGTVIIEQGQPGTGLFIVREGALEVARVDAGGKKTVLATLPAGKYVGEMSLVDEAPTSARVTAAGPVKALRIQRERFEKLLFENDRMAVRVYRSFVRTLSERLRQQNARA